MLIQNNYLLKVALKLDGNDCCYLVNTKNIFEQRKTGDWYCDIKNKIVIKKYCTKEWCENNCSINEDTVDRI